MGVLRQGLPQSPGFAQHSARTVYRFFRSQTASSSNWNFEKCCVQILGWKCFDKGFREAQASRSTQHERFFTSTVRNASPLRNASLIRIASAVRPRFTNGLGLTCRMPNKRECWFCAQRFRHCSAPLYSSVCARLRSWVRYSSLVSGGLVSSITRWAVSAPFDSKSTAVCAMSFAGVMMA